MKTISINLKALETMLFIWASLRDREKISDQVMIELANSPEMAGAYCKDFSTESVRKVLSAMCNRELLNGPTKKESRFWNYNMWMLEDAEMTDLMLKPIKTLNVNDLLKRFQDAPISDIEVVFYPGHHDLYKIIGNRLFINFFMLKVDIYGSGDVTIDNVSIKQFIENKILEIVHTTL